MSTLVGKKINRVRAVKVRFAKDCLFVNLSDGRILGVPFKRIPWLQWLAGATAKERAKWCLEPGGFAIYCPLLDDGIEVCHLLESENLT